MVQWYCAVHGQRFGPVSQEEIAGWIRDGRVVGSTQVWTEGMGAWAEARTVEALGELLAKAPPPVSAPGAGVAGGPPMPGAPGQLTCPACHYTGYMAKEWEQWVLPVAIVVAVFTMGLGLLFLLTPKKAHCPQCGLMFAPPYA